MKKIFLALLVGFLSFTMNADDVINDLVIIINPNTSPGTETSDEMSFIFFDATGKQVVVSYTYNSVTNTITIHTPGLFFVVITDKKTGKSKVVKIGTVSISS